MFCVESSGFLAHAASPSYRNNKVLMGSEEVGSPTGFLAYSATGTKQVGAKTYHSFHHNVSLGGRSVFTSSPAIHFLFVINVWFKIVSM